MMILLFTASIHGVVLAWGMIVKKGLSQLPADRAAEAAIAIAEAAHTPLLGLMFFCAPLVMVDMAGHAVTRGFVVRGTWLGLAALTYALGALLPILMSDDGLLHAAAAVSTPQPGLSHVGQVLATGLSVLMVGAALLNMSLVQNRTGPYHSGDDRHHPPHR